MPNTQEVFEQVIPALVSRYFERFSHEEQLSFQSSLVFSGTENQVFLVNFKNLNDNRKEIASFFSLNELAIYAQMIWQTNDPPEQKLDQLMKKIEWKIRESKDLLFISVLEVARNSILMAQKKHIDAPKLWEWDSKNLRKSLSRVISEYSANNAGTYCLLHVIEWGPRYFFSDDPVLNRRPSNKTCIGELKLIMAKLDEKQATDQDVLRIISSYVDTLHALHISSIRDPNYSLRFQHTDDYFCFLNDLKTQLDQVKKSLQLEEAPAKRASATIAQINETKNEEKNAEQVFMNEALGFVAEYKKREGVTKLHEYDLEELQTFADHLNRATDISPAEKVEFLMVRVDQLHRDFLQKEGLTEQDLSSVNRTRKRYFSILEQARYDGKKLLGQPGAAIQGTVKYLSKEVNKVFEEKMKEIFVKIRGMYAKYAEAVTGSWIAKLLPSTEASTLSNLPRYIIPNKVAALKDLSREVDAKHQDFLNKHPNVQVGPLKENSNYFRLLDDVKQQIDEAKIFLMGAIVSEQKAENKANFVTVAESDLPQNAPVAAAAAQPQQRPQAAVAASVSPQGPK